MKKKWLMSVGMILLLTLSIMGCQSNEKQGAKKTGSSGQEQTADKPKVLKVAMNAPVPTWDPSMPSGAAQAYLANIYEPLLWSNAPGSEEEFTPALAESWEHNDDGTIWTFHIRQGVTFHDGEPLDAEAVKKSFMRNIEKGVHMPELYASVEDIKVTDDYTVEFHLKSPIPFDKIVSSGTGAYIMSPKAADEDEEWFNQGNAAGTGPWQLKSYKAGEEIALEKNAQYWDEWNTNFEAVIVKIVQENVVQQQMLESGQVDIVQTVPRDNVEKLKQNSDIDVQIQPSFINYMGLINTKKPPLDNILVRQALSYAIPYEEIIKVAANGMGNQSKGPVPEGLWPGNESLKTYSQDIGKAKSLLKEAKVDPTELELTYTYASELLEEKRIAELVKEGLSELGVTVNIVPQLITQHFEKARGNAETAQDIFSVKWWPSLPDGYDNLKPLFRKEEKPLFNFSYYYNEELNQMIDDAFVLSSTDMEGAQDLYNKAQEMIIDEALALFYYDSESISARSSSLEGNGINPYYGNVIFFDELKTK